MGTVESLAPIDASPPNLRDEMCNGKRKRPATDEDADALAVASSASTGESAVSFFTAGLQAPMPKPSELLLESTGAIEPMVVYTGPKRTGAALIAAVATDADQQKTRRAKKSRGHKPAAVAEAKSDAKPEAKQAAKPEAKPAAAKPVRHATVKPEAKPEAAAKPAAAVKPAATAAKPAAKPATAAPAPKPAKPKAAAPKSDAKPAG